MSRDTKKEKDYLETGKDSKKDAKSDSKPVVRPSAPKSDIGNELSALKEKLADLTTENEALAGRVVELETESASLAKKIVAGGDSAQTMNILRAESAGLRSERDTYQKRVLELEKPWQKGDPGLVIESQAARIEALEKFLSEIQRTGTVDYGAIAVVLKK